MNVSDLSAIDAEVKVAEADVLRIRVGQTASVLLEAIPGRRFAGRVVEVGASALPVVGTQAAAREFRVVVRLDDADPSLRPGLTCDAEILTEEKKDVLTVPLQSVVLRPSPATAAGETAEDRPGVFLVKEDTVSFQPVTPGIIGGLAIEVTGVEEGAVVVTGPFQALRSLKDGAPVRVRQEGQR
jgi:HlyD family secretion protein